MSSFIGHTRREVVITHVSDNAAAGRYGRRFRHTPAGVIALRSGFLFGPAMGRFGAGI